MVHQALAAADWLATERIHAEVLNLSTIKPLDEELLVESVAKTGCLVTCEEHLVNGGLGGACAEALGERYPAPLERIGVRDTFGVSGHPTELMEYFGLMPTDIVAAVHRVISRKP
jgi:transketolase